LGLLARLGGEEELQLDLEFTPTCLGDFERGLLDCADILRICLVQLELDFLEPVGDVFAVDSADEDLPAVGVVGWAICWLVLWVKRVRDTAKDWSC
jgi:hypothetical protein